MGLRQRLRDNRKARKRKRKRKARKAEQLRELAVLLDANADRQRDQRDKRRGAEAAGDEAGQEAAADRLEELAQRRQQLLRKRDRARSVRQRLADAIAKLGKQIKRQAKRLRRRKHYASRHFTYSEFDCRDGTKMPDAAKPSLRHLCQEYLEPLRAHARRRTAGATVHINSGYRTPAYNARVGGVSNSIHIYSAHPAAVAADITVSGMSPAQVADFLDGLGPGGLGRYSTFTHVDNRQRMGWSRSRWWG